jgi:peptide/nickel transport system permease protein
VGVPTLVFILVELAPGNPFSLEPGAGVGSLAAERLREALGAGRPLPVRYLSWLRGFLTGDLGNSFNFRRPVVDLLRETMGNTLLLAGLALILQFILGTAAGILAASRPSRWLDRTLTGAAGLVYSIPSYWLGLALVWIFSVKLGWLPVSQMRSLDAASLPTAERLLDLLRHLALPCIALTLPAAAGIALFVREELKAVLARPFVRAALARGATRREVVLRHGLGGALVSLASLLGLALPGLVGGSAVLEVLFAWPGMGRLAYEAVLGRDEPLILGCAWLGSVTVIAGSLAADLLASCVDPRIRESLR